MAAMSVYTILAARHYSDHVKNRPAIEKIAKETDITCSYVTIWLFKHRQVNLF